MPPMRPPVACNPASIRMPQNVAMPMTMLPMIRPAMNAHIVEDESKIRVLEAGLSKELLYPMIFVKISKRMLATINPII